VESDQGTEGEAALRDRHEGRSIGGLWGNWRDPNSGEWICTFAVITTDATLVAEIHDRMPLILSPADYNRWLSDEPDARDLMLKIRSKMRSLTSLRKAARKRIGCGSFFRSQRGVGRSAISQQYAIGDLNESRRYIAHPVSERDCVRW
jgi:SOS response associated peptidase (SRAP)